MNTFFNILVVLSIVIILFAIIILSWALLAIRRKEKGLQDFKDVPFFAQNMNISYDISVTNTTKKTSINTVKKEQHKQTNRFFFAFSSKEKNEVNESIKLNGNSNLILN